MKILIKGKHIYDIRKLAEERSLLNKKFLYETWSRGTTRISEYEGEKDVGEEYNNEVYDFVEKLTSFVREKYKEWCDIEEDIYNRWENGELEKITNLKQRALIEKYL